jgi:Protein of unknown function (DUF3244).
MNLRIINQAGMLVSDYNTEVIQGIPVLIDVKSLSSGTYTVVFTDTLSGTIFNGRFVVIK